MNNIIQIKRGNGKPLAGVLAEGELGYDKKGKVLYIGVIVNNDDKDELVVEPVADMIKTQDAYNKAVSAEGVASKASQTAADAESTADRAESTANTIQEYITSLDAAMRQWQSRVQNQDIHDLKLPDLPSWDNEGDANDLL